MKAGLLAVVLAACIVVVPSALSAEPSIVTTGSATPTGAAVVGWSLQRSDLDGSAVRAGGLGMDAAPEEHRVSNAEDAAQGSRPRQPTATYTPARTTTPASRALAVPRGQPLTVERNENDVELAIVEAAREFDQDPALMLCVARAESGLRPDLLGRAGERGLMQFMPTTWGYYERGPENVAHWTGNSATLGYGEQDVWRPIPAARVAASMWRAGQQGQWHTYPKCAR